MTRDRAGVVSLRSLRNSDLGWGGSLAARNAVRAGSYLSVGYSGYQTWDAASRGDRGSAVYGAFETVIGAAGIAVPPLGVGYFMGKKAGEMMWPENAPITLNDVCTAPK